MSEHGVIGDFTKAKHGRLSKVDHEPEKHQRSQMSNTFSYTSTASIEN